MDKKLFIVFNSLDIGGIETKIIDICQYYSQQKNIKAFLLLKNRTGLLLGKLPKNVTLLSPQVTNLLKIKTAIFPFWLSLQFKKYRPNLVIAFGNYCGISSVIGKTLSASATKIIISDDSSIVEQIESDTFSNFRKYLVKITYPAADKIITLTSTGKNKLNKIIPNINNKIAILNNWLPLNFKPTNKLKKDIDILFLGRFEPQKNPLEFLAISQKLINIFPHFKIVMIGYGSLLTQIKNYITSNHLTKNISILPATVHPEKYLNRSKILLLTSFHEGFPLTILEASASNCIPICRRLPELESYFTYQRIYTLYNNINQAVDILNDILSDTELIKDICLHYCSKAFDFQGKNFQSTISLINEHL